MTIAREEAICLHRGRIYKGTILNARERGNGLPLEYYFDGSDNIRGFEGWVREAEEDKLKEGEFRWVKSSALARPGKERTFHGGIGVEPLTIEEARKAKETGQTVFLFYGGDGHIGRVDAIDEEGGTCCFIGKPPYVEIDKVSRWVRPNELYEMEMTIFPERSEVSEEH
ncbi:hypothetical protein ACFL11_00390 [Patescibacteria group bacterium]